MNVNSAVYKPKIDTDLQRQMAEVRKEAARRYAEQQKLNQTKGDGTPPSGPSCQPLSMSSTSATATNTGNAEKRKLIDAGSDDDVEFVGATKKPKTLIGDSAGPRPVGDSTGARHLGDPPGPRLYRNEATRFPTPRFPKPRLLLTRTPGRAMDGSPTHMNNTINFSEIMGPMKGRTLGIKSAWLYSFFIANSEFQDELPLSPDPSAKVEQPQVRRRSLAISQVLIFLLPQIYVGRDPNQDPIAFQLREALGIPSREENGNKPLNANDYRRLTTACTEEYRRRLGDGYIACYPPTSDSGGKFSGCAHSKFGILLFNGFMRVSPV